MNMTRAYVYGGLRSEWVEVFLDCVALSSKWKEVSVPCTFAALNIM